MRSVKGEFWTNQQRQGHSLHQTPYYGSFQPGLPEFFIRKYSVQGDVISDPFAGRGTTVLQAMLMGRVPAWREVNPYGRLLIIWKLALAQMTQEEVGRLWGEVEFTARQSADAKYQGPALWTEFFHPGTEELIRKLFRYEPTYGCAGLHIKTLLSVLLTGHSPGYLSVRTMPPNIQVTCERQKKLNEKSGNYPSPLSLEEFLQKLRKKHDHLTKDCAGCENPKKFNLGSASKNIVITSPPFVDLIDYVDTNWMRNQLINPDMEKRQEIHERDPKKWAQVIWAKVLKMVPRGKCYCLEAGVVRGGRVNLIEFLEREAVSRGLKPVGVYIQNPAPSRTSKCWGVEEDQGTTQQQVAVFKWR